MKNILRILSILLLTCFSFFYTDKVINMINKKDPLMIEINNVKDEYKVFPVNAIIEGDTIVPGTKGMEVDIYKSYDEMKLGGIFRKEELVYKDLFPNDSLSNNRDKYIIKGNSSRKNVSLLVIFNIDDIDKINSIDNVTVFINHENLTIANINMIKNKEIYSYGNGGIYNENILVNDNTIINRVANNKSKYCLLKDKDNSILELCNGNGMYTIVPTIIGDYSDVKNNLSNGSIILLTNNRNISIVSRYITSKGYEIIRLSKLLEE